MSAICQQQHACLGQQQAALYTLTLLLIASVTIITLAFLAISCVVVVVVAVVARDVCCYIRLCCSLHVEVACIM
jgi:hypothetical protein